MLKKWNGAALYDLAAGRCQGRTPMVVLSVHTKSVRLLRQFELRNRSQVSGTSPLPASIIFCMSAGAWWRQDLHQTSTQT